MRILIVGAGATGGYFGACLAAAGRDVTFLVRPRRAAELAAGGLQILSPSGDWTIRPKLVLGPEIAGAFDLVLLTVKAHALAGALDDIGPAMGPDTVLFPILNGMRHIDVLVERFGDRVIGGVCRVATTLDGSCRIRQIAPGQELTFGELSGGASARIAAIDAALQGCGFTARATPDILQAMWDKWIMLAALGALTCLMRGTVGEIAAAPGGPAVAAALVGETAAVAAAAGHPPAEAYVAATRAMLTAAGSPMTSSLYRDQQAGLPLEADHILGDLLARARGFGLATPLLDAAAVSLAVHARRTAPGA